MNHLSLPQKLTEGYLSALFFLLPLYVHNAYFDITEAKVGCFALLSALYVSAMAFAELKCPGESGAKPACFGFLAYIALTLLSSLLYIGKPALLAPSNRYQGIFVLGLYALVFLFCSRHGSFGPWSRTAALSALSLVSLWAVLQSFGLDPLGLWDGIRAADRGRYLSTIGNVNFLGAYCSLLLPLCGGLYCKERKWPLLCVFALSCLGLLCGSDSGILGTAAALLLLYALTAGEERTQRAFGLLLAVFALSVFAYGLLLQAFGFLSLSALGKLVASPFVSLPLFAVGLLLWKKGRGAKRPWLLPAAVCGGSVAVLLVCNLRPALVPLSVRDVLVFSAHWGSDRGAIWLHALELYRSFSPVQKLIGGGSGCLAAYDAANRLFPDAVVDCAHNEYLQILLTSGALGLAAYLFALLAALREGAKKRPALAAAVFGCAVQAAVNIAQCATTPLLVVLLALL